MCKKLLRKSIIALSCISIILVFACKQDSDSKPDSTTDTNTTVTTDEPNIPTSDTTTDPVPDPVDDPASNPAADPVTDPTIDPESGSEQIITYTITYNLDGGQLANGISLPTSYTQNDHLYLPNASKISKTGYSFSGWYEGNNMSFGFSEGTTGNKTFTAKWAEGNKTPVGFYNLGTNNIPCSQGTYQNTMHASFCISCPSGTIAPGSGFGKCITCPEGTHANQSHSACVAD